MKAYIDFVNRYYGVLTQDRNEPWDYEVDVPAELIMDAEYVMSEFGRIQEELMKYRPEPEDVTDKVLATFPGSKITKSEAR